MHVVVRVRVRWSVCGGACAVARAWRKGEPWVRATQLMRSWQVVEATRRPLMVHRQIVETFRGDRFSPTGMNSDPVRIRVRFVRTGVCRVVHVRVVR